MQIRSIQPLRAKLKELYHDRDTVSIAILEVLEVTNLKDASKARIMSLVTGKSMDACHWLDPRITKSLAKLKKYGLIVMENQGCSKYKLAPDVREAHSLVRTEVSL